MNDKKIGVGVGVAILNDEGKVLLGHRSKISGSELGLDNVWALPGGNLEYGESFEEAGAREVLEETGLTVRKLVVRTVQIDKNEKAHYVTLGLVANGFDGEPQILEPEKFTEWGWFDLDRLPKNMYFPSTKLIKKYKKGVFYEEER